MFLRQASKRPLSAVICLAVLANTVAGNLWAQSARDGRPQATALTSPVNERAPAVFRQNLSSVVDQAMALQASLGLPAEGLEHIAELREKFNSASEEDVARVAELMGPDLARAQRTLARIVVVPAPSAPGGKPAPNGLQPAPKSGEAWEFDPTDVVQADTPAFTAGTNNTSGGIPDRFCALDGSVIPTACTTDNDCIGVPGCPICDQGPCIDNPNLKPTSGTLTLQIGCTDRPSEDLRKGLLLAATILEAVRVIADRICEETIAGVNISVACIIVDVLAVAGKAAYDFTDLCSAFWGEAESKSSYDRLGHMHGDLEAAQASVDALQGTLENGFNETTSGLGDVQSSVDSHFNDTTTQINADYLSTKQNIDDTRGLIQTQLTAQTDLFLQAEIERALLNQERLAIYYLPEAQGGRLGLIQTIVQNTITRVTASGEKPNNALKFLGSAVANVAAGKFKDAFNNFSMAYREATKN